MADTVTDPCPPDAVSASMFLFDATADDDLLVLAAYAAAEEAQQNERKAQCVDQTTSDPAPAGSSVAASDNDGQDIDSAELETSTTARTMTWIPRLREVADVPHDRLTPIHGRLIAHGLLQFQLLGREEGVVYRLTPAGRKALCPSLDEAA